MTWLNDVMLAKEVVRRGRFKAATHGGVAHADDTLAAALLHRAGSEAIYRLNTAEEAEKIEGDVVLFDIGDSFKDRLPPRFVVLDHHGVSDPAEEPSSAVQVALAVEAKPTPLVATLLHFLDLFDRFGPVVKKWAGPYGNSLSNGMAKYFSDAAPTGLVKDEKFLALLADAFYSKLDLDPQALTEAFRVAEKVPAAQLAAQFPRTFQTLKLMVDAASNPAVLTSKEAYETGFGVDFACYAVLAVPELESYVVRGLERHYAEAKRAAELASAGRYVLVDGVAYVAVAAEDHVPPGPLYNALMDLGQLPDKPVFVVVKDRRNPGAYTLWRPDKYANVVDFRRLSGDALIFKHASGFLAVVKAASAEEAARWALARL